MNAKFVDGLPRNHYLLSLSSAEKDSAKQRLSSIEKLLGVGEGKSEKESRDLQVLKLLTDERDRLRVLSEERKLAAERLKVLLAEIEGDIHSTDSKLHKLDAMILVRDSAAAAAAAASMTAPPATATANGGFSLPSSSVTATATSLAPAAPLPPWVSSSSGPPQQLSTLQAHLAATRIGGGAVGGGGRFSLSSSPFNTTPSSSYSAFPGGGGTLRQRWKQ